MSLRVLAVCVVWANTIPCFAFGQEQRASPARGPDVANGGAAEKSDPPALSLSDCLDKLLDRQLAVFKCTKHLHRTIQGRKPRAEHRDEARRLAAMEGEILAEFVKATDRVDLDALREAFREVLLDMKRVRSRLQDTNVGTDSQSIEQDVIDALRDMVAALKKR